MSRTSRYRFDKRDLFPVEGKSRRSCNQPAALISYDHNVVADERLSPATTVREGLEFVTAKVFPHGPDDKGGEPKQHRIHNVIHLGFLPALAVI
jgi:hypothetical protein